MTTLGLVDRPATDAAPVRQTLHADGALAEWSTVTATGSRWESTRSRRERANQEGCASRPATRATQGDENPDG